MDVIYSKRNRLATGCIIIALLLICSSCAYDKEYIKYTTDQISALRKTTEELKESTASGMENVNSSQAALMVEIQTLKKELMELSGRVEDNEHLIKHTVEKELGAQGDAATQLSNMAEKVDRLEKMVNYHHLYLNLEPFEYISRGGAPSGQAEGNVTIVNTVSGVQKSEDELLYESSLDLFNARKYEQALTGFKSFLDTYPKSKLADNAQFWIGECFMGLKDYKPAIQAFQKVIEDYPDENKVPNAMYRQAVAWQLIGDSTTAKLRLKNLIKMYPDSVEAQDAEKKLSALN